MIAQRTTFTSFSIGTKTAKPSVDVDDKVSITEINTRFFMISLTLGFRTAFLISLRRIESQHLHSPQKVYLREFLKLNVFCEVEKTEIISARQLARK
jgi:K+ transporter